MEKCDNMIIIFYVIKFFGGAVSTAMNRTHDKAVTQAIAMTMLDPDPAEPLKNS